MSTVLAIQTPIRCSGVPTIHNVPHVEFDSDFVFFKEYKCFSGHAFTLTFTSPMDIPVFWECPHCEIIAAES